MIGCVKVNFKRRKYVIFKDEMPAFAGIKKRQATYITPLRPHTFAAFPPWRIQQELVV